MSQILDEAEIFELICITISEELF